MNHLAKVYRMIAHVYAFLETARNITDDSLKYDLSFFELKFYVVDCSVLNLGGLSELLDLALLIFAK